MMLRCGLGHELSYAFVKRAVSYQIWTGAKGGGVSGSPGGDADEACAKAGIEAIQGKLDF
jgi:uncharacterized protein GlcG (DUF336 family)